MVNVLPFMNPDEDGEEALPNEANHVSKRTELHGSHPEINPNEGGKEAYVIEGEEGICRSTLQCE